MINPNDPRTPIVIEVRTTADFQEYKTPPLVIPNKRRTVDAVRIVTPSQSTAFNRCLTDNGSDSRWMKK